MSERADKLKRWGGLAVSLALLAAGAYVVWRLVRDHSPRELARLVLDRPPASLALALILALLAWAALAGYDALSFRMMRTRLPLVEVLRDAFTSYALAFNLGASAFTGGAVRVRLYGRHGVGPKDVTRLMAANVTTMWSGFALIAGVAFTLWPVAIPGATKWGPAAVRVIGVACLALVALYLVLAWRGKTLHVRAWEYPLPTLPWAAAQIGVAAAHWTCAAAVVHALLPGDVPFLRVLGLYLLAAIAGSIAHVPGGLGVTEGVFVLALESEIPEPAVLGAVLAFRALFLWLPLLASLALFAQHELRPRAEAEPVEA